jgi:uncharacterized protein (DUF1778 family)
MADAPADVQWDLRVPREAHELVQRAAQERGQNVESFVVETTLAEAHRVLADRVRFVLGAEDWSALLNRLAQPAQLNQRLSTLFSRYSKALDE